MRIITIICCAIIFGNPSLAQKLSVRKAFESKTADDDKPAIFSYTGPTNKANSFLVNAGLGYQFLDKKIKQMKLKLNSFFVYNFNNQISKKQHNYKLGITGQTQFGQDEKCTFFGSHAIQYLRDYIDTNHSALVTTYWHIFSEAKGKPHFGAYSNPKKFFSYYLQPKIGLEYQYLIGAKQKLVKAEGFDFRSFESIGAFLLFHSKPDATGFRTRLIELVTSYDFRQSIKSNILNNVKSSYLFKSGINFYPTKNGNFSVGASYNDGEDPVAAMPKQKYWLITLQFKLN